MSTDYLSGIPVPSLKALTEEDGYTIRRFEISWKAWNETAGAYEAIPGTVAASLVGGLELTDLPDDEEGERVTEEHQRTLDSAVEGSQRLEYVSVDYFVGDSRMSFRFGKD